MTEPLRCHDCGEVIGVYEPLITLVDGRARETSLAVESEPGGPGANCYHRACYERLHGSSASCE